MTRWLSSMDIKGVGPGLTSAGWFVSRLSSVERCSPLMEHWCRTEFDLDWQSHLKSHRGRVDRQGGKMSCPRKTWHNTNADPKSTGVVDCERDGEVSRSKHCRGRYYLVNIMQLNCGSHFFTKKKIFWFPLEMISYSFCWSTNIWSL